MTQRLLHKRAIITGSASGIGMSIAYHFSLEGARVIINYPDDKQKHLATRLVNKIKRNGGEAYAIKADVTQIDQVRYLISHTIKLFQGIDILVNNAGICPWSEFLNTSLDTWQITQDVNHLGTFLCSQIAAREMIKQNSGGSIISIGSVGAYTGNVMQAHYNSSKAAISSLTRSMAVALGKYKIRCNAILPGCIKTRINKKVLSRFSYKSSIVSRTPLKRLGSPLDIVGAAIYFGSDESRFCTGAELIIDGGISINT